MRKLIFFVIFCSLFILRWLTLASPLPETWTAETLVRFTAPIIDQVEHTDTKTIVRIGVWYIPIRGYAAIIPGDVVSFSGSVHPQLLGGKPVRIMMEDPTFEVVTTRSERQLSLTELVLLSLLTVREQSVDLLEKWLGEPMSSLAAGILFGIKGQMPSDFYEQLVNTGTVHIVAASGYNVAVVATLIMTLVGKWCLRGVVIFWGLFSIWLYVLLSGSSASILRAGIMGSLTLMAYYLGRPAEARRLLWVSAALMLLVDPLMLVDIGFQLSVAATAGLLYLEPWLLRRARFLPPFLHEYLVPTLAATLVTAPLILWHFGRVAWISPLVNILVLPAIPLLMGMTALVVILGFISPTIGVVLAWLLYVPLWWVVAVIRWWG